VQTRTPNGDFHRQSVAETAHSDTIVHSKSVMEFVISEVGAERIMIRSDYCLDMGYDHSSNSDRASNLLKANLPN
jgi:hypothetical protein